MEGADVRIAIMWRHFWEKGGIGVYTDAVIRNLLQQDDRNDYILLVPPGARPSFAFPNLRRIEVTGRTRWSWDQWAVPRVAAREQADLVFNPKLSVPLHGPFATAFALHGMEQIVQARSFPRLDRLYVKATMPRYCRRADAILCPSERVKAEIAERMRVRPERIHVTPYGVGDRFLRAISPDQLLRVRERYGLPARYLLFVGGVTPLKNLPTMFRAMARLKDRIPHTLVLSGFTRWKSAGGLELLAPLALTDRVINVGWVDDGDQPALYRLASALLLPSLYEGFGFPVVEAMACGCPVITSTEGSLPEVAGGAALLVHPMDDEALADAVRQVVEDPERARQLAALGLQRAQSFRWDRTARRVGEVFDAVVLARRSG